MRETSYDLDEAVQELRAAGFADVEEQLGGSLLDPTDPGWVSAFFEHGAGRGEDPGEPPTRPSRRWRGSGGHDGPGIGRRVAVSQPCSAVVI